MLNRVAGMWELLGASGELIRSVSALYVDQFGLGQVNAHAAQRPRFWPPLRGRSYVHLVLVSGQGCLHVYLDPDEAPGPPATVAVRGQVFRPVVQGCGHGGDCAYPYAAEHTG